MTRTERNQYPAALLKDRHSRSGLVHQTEVARKNGAGAHNWGSYTEESDLEAAARRDADAEVEADGGEPRAVAQAPQAMFEMEGEESLGPLPVPKAVLEITRVNGYADKGNHDDAISTSPSESMSSLDSVGGHGLGQVQKERRMSNVSDAERESAKVYREGVTRNGQLVDLAHIARTSYGIAQSPPSFSTSPIKAMAMGSHKQ